MGEFASKAKREEFSQRSSIARVPSVDLTREFRLKYGNPQLARYLRKRKGG
jgi:hypothetical protein